MHLSYLCTKHTDWVYSNPDQAIYFLARDELQGTMLYAEGQFRECIAYLGCAFDIATILLEVEEGQNASLIEKINSLASMLSEAYRALAEFELQSAVLQQAQRIVQAANDTPFMFVYA